MSARKPLLSTKPKARAARALEDEEQERQIAAAVRWVAAAPDRTPSAALATGNFPLVTSAEALRAAMRGRLDDGSRVERKDNELLTPEELDNLRQRYVARGFVGSCGSKEQKMLQQGVLDILNARGPDGPTFTSVELAKIRPGATAVSKSWCEKITNRVKRELAVRRDIQTWVGGVGP
jgi:hypothetical protein